MQNQNKSPRPYLLISTPENPLQYHITWPYCFATPAAFQVPSNRRALLAEIWTFRGLSISCSDLVMGFHCAKWPVGTANASSPFPGPDSFCCWDLWFITALTDSSHQAMALGALFSHCVDAHPIAGLYSAALSWNIWAGSAAFLQVLLRELHFGNAQQLHSSLLMKTHRFVDMKHKMPSGRWCYSGSVHRDSFSLHLSWCSRCRDIISEQFFNTSKSLFNIFLNRIFKNSSLICHFLGTKITTVLKKGLTCWLDTRDSPEESSSHRRGWPCCQHWTSQPVKRNSSFIGQGPREATHLKPAER